MSRSQSGGHAPAPALSLAEPRLIERRLVKMLFRILKKAWEHLHQELCKDEPKSVCKKAHDIQRNLPRWNGHVRNVREQVRQSTKDGRDVKIAPKVMQAYKEVMHAAGTAIANLHPLVSAGVKKNLQAETEWRILHDLLKATSETVGLEYQQLKSHSS